MEAADILRLIAEFGPGLSVGALGLYFGHTKDRQCSTLMDRLAALGERQVSANEKLTARLDALIENLRGNR